MRIPNRPTHLCVPPQGGPKLHAQRVQRFKGQAHLLEPLLRPLRQLILRYEHAAGGVPAAADPTLSHAGMRLPLQLNLRSALGSQRALGPGMTDAFATQHQPAAHIPAPPWTAGLPEVSRPLLEELLGAEEDSGEAGASSASPPSGQKAEAEANGHHEEL